MTQATSDSFVLNESDTLPENEFPDLFFGIVAPIGTPREFLKKQLAERLEDAHYTPFEVKLSNIIRVAREWDPVSRRMEEIWEKDPYNQSFYDEKMGHLMDLGNEVRRATEEQSAVAIMGCSAINSFVLNAERENTEPFAFILDQLKRPEEVHALQKIYGQRFHLIGCTSPESERLSNLAGKIARSHNSSRPDEFRTMALELANRDYFEHADDFGQDVRSTFSNADVFISVNPNQDRETAWQVERYVALIFKNSFLTPVRDEHGMQLAHAAALNSADLARQVGAAICTPDGSCLTVGWNEVPKAGGGVYWASVLDQEQDARDWRGISDPMTESRSRVLTEVVNALRTHDFIVDHIKGRTEKEFLRDLTHSNADHQKRITKNVEVYFEAPTKQARAKALNNLRDELNPFCRTDAAIKMRDEFLAFIEKARETKRGTTYANYLIRRLIRPILVDSEIMNINEFGRSVHAELVAITDAARRGVSLAGSTLFSTTFPCHECARHIVAAGITRVVYIQPYPKSYAKESHPDAIQVDDLTYFTIQSKVRFEPYVGVGPRRYRELFHYQKGPSRRKQPNGDVAEWTPRKPGYAEPAVAYSWREAKYAKNLENISGYQIRTAGPEGIQELKSKRMG